MSKYTIIGRQKNGTTIDGYILRDNATGAILPFPKNQVYKLALNKMISDVTAQVYQGRVTMKGTKYRISELPCYDVHGNKISKGNEQYVSKPKVIINGKCTDGKNVTGYRVAVVVDGIIQRQSVLNREKVMELARNGMISNARYQTSNGIGILRGVDCKLANLPNVEYEMA